MFSNRIMFKLSALIFVGVLLIAIAPHSSVQAIGNTSGGFTGGLYIDNGTCNENFVPIFAVTTTGTTDDNAGYDYYAVIFVDGDGNPLDVDIHSYPVAVTSSFDFGADMGIDEFNPPTARPLTGAVFDIPYPYGSISNENTLAAFNWVLANGTFVMEDYLDPTTIGSGPCGALPLLSPYSFAPAPSFYVPNVGLVKIDTSSPQPVYEDPAGSVVRNPNGSELWIPQDYDGNGYDTYTVTDMLEVDGAYWIQIFLGSEHFVWVPLANVTVLELAE